jgi:hypothetical protein
VAVWAKALNRGDRREKAAENAEKGLRAESAEKGRAQSSVDFCWDLGG